MKIKSFGYALLALALVLSASMPIAFKLGSNISPLKLMFFASLVGTIVSLFVTIAKGTTRRSFEYFTKRTPFLVMATFGVLDYTILTLIFSYATHFVSASLVAVIYRTWALMLVLLAPFIIRERISKYDIAAVLIGFSSFAVVMLQGTPLSMPVAVLPFVGIVLVGAFLDAFTNAVTKRYSYELTSSIFAYNLIAFAIFLPLALIYGQASLAGMSASDIMAIAFIGIVVDVALTFAFVDSIRMLNVTLVGTTNILVPFITIALSFVLLGERMYWYYFVIAIGVAAGLLVQHYAPKRSNYISKNKSTRGYAIFDVSGAFAGTGSPTVYKMLKGNGRALAVKLAASKKVYDIMEQNGRLGGQDGYMIFTDSRPFGEISKNELDFIKDIVGAEENDTVIIGVGKPELVEERLANLTDISGISREKPI
ncbi:MAG: EamA family transporter [Candidatus Marsarchaeota archaeon]|jgi:drug/metabolite transporter (DMT)-like permease|nr:EamA family transporter [Candidatus Marsarchaeota archaeon]MCL5418978.1 EamA family transporter [Candidatus Marsarchaeota archaeon]